MHTVVNIFAVIGLLVLLVLLFPLGCWIMEKRESKQLQKSRYWKEFRKIADWSGDCSFLEHIENYKEERLAFEVIYFLPLSYEPNISDMYEFNPANFPKGIRPDSWFVHFWDEEHPENTQAHEVVLCNLDIETANWRTVSRYSAYDNIAEITLKDRCGVTIEARKDIEQLNRQRFCWRNVIVEAYQIIMHGNSVCHYELRKLEDEIAKK